MNRFLPLGIFVALLVLLGVGLHLDPREVPSPLINKAAPDFRLPDLKDPSRSIARADLLGKVTLLNVWASWCSVCRDEQPLLVDMARRYHLTLYGLDYKDERADALMWLQRFGDPYLLTGYDADGRTGINYGVYGVPETYVIDRDGIIRYKHIGPLTPEVLEKTILPLVKKLNHDPA